VSLRDALRKPKGGETIHYLAFLDEEGNTLQTQPLVEPISIPEGSEVFGDMTVTLSLQWRQVKVG
jgi:hypothetical protein